MLLAIINITGSHSNQNYDGPKNPYMSIFSHTMLGPDYYVPLRNRVFAENLVGLGFL